MPIVTLLRDLRLYVLLKGVSDCTAKLEISDGGKVEILLFTPDIVMSFLVDDSDWNDLEHIKQYIINEIGSKFGD